MDAGKPDDGYRKLQQIAGRLRNGEKVGAVTVRELLDWFGAKRRGANITFTIDEALGVNELRTEPYFYQQYIDSPIEFQLTEPIASNDLADNTDALSADTDQGVPELSIRTFSGDPTFRIGRLRSANLAPTCVSPNQSITEAITIMLERDFSQLPVMVGDRVVKGMVSWRSLGMRLALGVKCTEVRECMEMPRVISADTSMLDAIDEIVRNQYVLIRDRTEKISGIVTTSDLSMQFEQLSEPFLLLGEIENHMRTFISRAKFTPDDLRRASDPGDATRVVNSVFDLNFGEYIRCGLSRCPRFIKI